MRDRLHAVEEEERHEVDFLSRQVEDISDVNGSNVRIKEILSNQIVNQNDSFGKLYEITSSLDKYEPSEVLFYAAEVLAKLMDSRDVCNLYGGEPLLCTSVLSNLAEGADARKFHSLCADGRTL